MPSMSPSRETADSRRSCEEATSTTSTEPNYAAKSRSRLGILLEAQPCSPDRCPAVRREPDSAIGRHIAGTRGGSTSRRAGEGTWQGRFASFVIDEDHLLIAARYVELNPVGRVGPSAEPYRWSSAAADLRARRPGTSRSVVQMAPNSP